VKRAPKLPDERTRSKRAAGIDEPLGSQESWCSIRIVDVTSEVGFVGQVKRLEDELEVPTLTDANVLGDAQIHVEECIASKGVIADLMALRRS